MSVFHRGRWDWRGREGGASRGLGGCCTSDTRANGTNFANQLPKAHCTGPGQHAQPRHAWRKGSHALDCKQIICIDGNAPSLCVCHGATTDQHCTAHASNSS